MTKPRRSGSKGTEEVVQGAILIEMENVAFRGRQLFHDVLEKVLNDKGMKLEPEIFSRYCLDAPSRQFVTCLLKSTNKPKLSEDKLLSDILDALKVALNGKLKIETAFKELIKVAEEKALIGGLSSLDKDAAVRLMTDLGLPGMDSRILSCADEHKNFPGANMWMKLANSMRIPSSRCVAIATSAASCNSALAARMRIVAIPDKFTSFQDFGGADAVFESLDKNAVSSVLELLKSATS